MEKIFVPEVEEYLRETGVSDVEINTIKFTVLKNKALERLKLISDLIMKDKFDEIKAFTCYSGSGDGWGDTNNFIDFGFIMSEKDSCDILELCELLKDFKK